MQQGEVSGVDSLVAWLWPENSSRIEAMIVLVMVLKHSKR